jgi:predicted transcriptional regulator
MSKGRNTTVVGARLPDELVTRLKALARSRRRTISELVTQAVRELVDYSHLSDEKRQTILERRLPKVEIKKEETFPVVARNAPCPCGAKNPDGSPKKYKRCHGRFK